MAFEEAMGFGGAWVDLKHIVRELMDRGVRVTIVHSYGGECWRDPDLQGARLIRAARWDLAERMSLAGRGTRSARMAAYALDLGANQLPQALRHAAYAKRHGVTAMLLNNSLTHNVSGAMAARLLGLPIYAYFQGFEHAGALLPRMLPWMTRGFAVSEYIREVCHEMGIDRAGVDTLYPGITPPDASLAAPRPAEARPIRVGMVGMITPWKGQAEFLDAFALARASAPELEAWLFGRAVPGHEPYAEAVQQKIDHLGLRGCVRIVGDRSTPETMYPEVDFTVHSSIEPEPFGRVVIEALAFGRPIIAADDGGPGEVVREGETGFLANPADPEAVAQRMVQLGTDHDLRNRMGAAGRADVLERFAYPGVLEPLLRRFP